MKKAFLLLLPVIFLLGCIGTPTINANNGLIVNEFSADPAMVESDDVVRLLLDVENVGGTTAKCITTEIYGVDSWRDEFGTPYTTLFQGPIGPLRGLYFNYVDGNFNVCYSDYTRQSTGGTTGSVCVSRVKDQGVGIHGFVGNAFIDFQNNFCRSFEGGVDYTQSLTRYQPELIPPQPSLGRAGQSQIFEWLVRPPVLPEGVEADYPITARTSFFYDTNAIMNIQAFNKAEFKRRADLGQPTDYPLSIQNSFGSPLQIFVTRGSSPVVVNTELGFERPLQLESYKFEFVNLGEGFPLPMSGVDHPSYPDADTQSGFVLATMSVNGPGVYFYDCLGQTGQEIFVPSSTFVKLRSDQRVPVGCTIAIDRNQWADKPVGTITFQFNLEYRYYIDRSVVLKVLGQEGLPGRAIIR